MKKKPPRIVINVLILLLAPFLAWALFYLTQYAGTHLTASVLDLNELQAIKDQGRDVAYKTSSWLLELFGSESAKKRSTLQITLVYDEDELELFPESALQEGIELVLQKPWLLYYQLSAYQNNALENEWFAINFSGEEKRILIWEVYAVDQDQTPVPLAVGNLNSLDIHEAF